MPFDIRDFARRGAEVRIRELREEIAQILRAFPDLSAPKREKRTAYPPNELAALGGRAAPGRANALIKIEETGRKRRRRRRKMTAAERKAVGERMRRYWASRKKAAAK